MKYNEATPINDIKPYDKNPRFITAEATSAVAASIAEFGFLNPIVIDANGVILAGHNRYQAAKKLGLKTVPTLTTDISELKARGYRIASNKTGELAQWDRAMLDEELGEIMRDCDSLVGAMGISDWEVKRAQALAEASAGVISTNQNKKAAPPAPSIPSRPIDGVPQVLRTVLILDKQSQAADLLEMLGLESISEIPTTMHASEAFKNV